MKKIVVEDCLILSINDLVKEKLMKSEYRWQIIVNWKSGSSITIKGIVDDLDRNCKIITLCYRADKEKIEYDVIITPTPSKRGNGKLFWFLCPLILYSQPCLRRVRKLYLPYNAKYFGCRHCYDLSYTSRQEWSDRKRSKALKEMFRNCLRSS